MNGERVLVLLKPDGVELGLRVALVSGLTAQSLVLREEWSLDLDEETVRRLYSKYQSAWFFPMVVEFLTSGPSLVTVWEGPNAIEKAKRVRGSSYDGTGFRGRWSSVELIGPDGRTVLLKNVLHVSDQGCVEHEYGLLNPNGRLPR